MNRAGESVSKRPAVPLIVLAIITAAALGMIAMNPPSFGMDEGSFMPDNEMIRASNIISEEFTSSASVMSLVDARSAGDDIFTKDAFLDILGYERSLYEMKYTGTDGIKYSYSDHSYIDPSDVGLNGFMILSPVSAVAGAIAGSSDYNVMIATIGSPGVTDSVIKMYASAVIAGEPMLASLLSNDYDSVSVTAGGCIISLMITDSELDKIQDGELGFEGDVISAAKGFSPSHAGGLKIKAMGMQTMMNDIGDMAQKDISMLLPIAIVVIIILLFVIYRDVSDTLVGLLGLFIAIIWTFGISALINIPMSTIAIAVPILILALGIDYSLHMVFRYREERSAGKSPKESIAMTMGSVGQALVLATVTTAIAFLSYLTSQMSALADFGVMCAIGIVCAFAVMLLLIPATQVMRDRKAERKGKDPDDAKRYKKAGDESKDTLGKISGVGGRMAARSPWAVLGVAVLIVALFGYSATNLSYDFDMYEFIPEETEAHDIILYMDENYNTTTSTTSVLIYGDPWKIDTILKIEESLDNMAADPIRGVSYTSGSPDAEYLYTALSDANDRIGDPMYDMLFNSTFDSNGRLIISPMTETYLGALEANTPDILLSSVVGEHNGEAITRIILKMTTEIESDNNAILAMRDAVNEACSPLGDIGAEYVVTGQFVILAATMTEMNNSQMTSLFVTIIFVILILTFVMYYTHRSFLLGIMATIPTLISVVMVWGTMAAIGMPLNVMTLTIASLAVGMGVTYGIHISNRFATELIRNDMDAKDAIKKTTRETGKGVFAAMATTVAGFGVMVFSKILPMYQFGIITALAILFGYAGAVLVLPSMLVIWGRHVKPKLMSKRSGTASSTATAAAAAAGTGMERYAMRMPEGPDRTYPEWDGSVKRTADTVPYPYRRGRKNFVRRRPKI